LLSPFPRAASALLDPSSKAAATKMEKVRIKVRIIETTSIMCCQLNGGVRGTVPCVQPQVAEARTASGNPMPYLVVTVSPKGVTATAVESKEEARVLASKKTMKVDFQESSKPSEAPSV
jgi:hypothetical protein